MCKGRILSGVDRMARVNSRTVSKTGEAHKCEKKRHIVPFGKYAYTFSKYTHLMMTEIKAQFLFCDVLWNVVFCGISD